MYGRIFIPKNLIFPRNAFNQASKQFSTQQNLNSKYSKWILLISGASVASSIGYVSYHHFKNANKVFALQQRKVNFDRFKFSSEF